MVGQISYTTEQILFVLEQILADEKRDVILHEYKKKFSRPLSVSQLRYIKNKYGHDPEFGQPIQSVQPMKDVPYSPVVHMPRLDPDYPESLPAGYQDLQYLADYTSRPPDKASTSLERPSGEEQTQLQPQSQLQNEIFPQYQSQISTLELFGTYWFDQYAPTAYPTPYGYQPILHYNNQLLYPSTTQKRQLEEPVGQLPNLTERLTMPIDWFNGLSSLPTVAPEPVKESMAKRMRMESQEGDSNQTTTATPAQTPMNIFANEAIEQSNTNFCFVTPSEETATPNSSDKADSALYINDDKNELFPWSQFIKEADPETQTEDSVPMSSSLQMPQMGDNIAYTNGTSAGGLTSDITSMAMATHPPLMSTDTSVTFSDATWDQLFDETEFGVQGNHQASSLHSPQLSEAGDPALDPASDQAMHDALQALLGDAIVNADTNGSGLNGENQGQPTSDAMAVPEQKNSSDGLGFLDSLDDFDDDFDWSVDQLPEDEPHPVVGLPPSVDPGQGVDGQVQLSPSEYGHDLHFIL